MSFVSEKISHAVGVSALDRRGAPQRLVERARAFVATLARRKAVDELGRLDDHLLADAGLTRADLRAAAKYSLWADPTDRLATLAEKRRGSSAG